MTQAKQTGKQPLDPYAQRGKTLTSSVKRLRGWVGSDPTKNPELADALVALTGHRLLGHAYAAAAPDATEAVRRASELLTANGPLGPYTSVEDAVRFVTAVAHLATVQVGMGLPDAAGRTIGALPGLRDQLSQLPLDDHLDVPVAIMILLANGRAALAAGEVATANAYADAALARRAESGLDAEEELTYLGIDVDRLAADCRWAAGRAEESLTSLHVALDHYEAYVAGRLAEPGRLPPALVERLAEPLFGLHRDLADRLVAHGDTDLGLVTRRAAIDRLRGLVKPLGDPVRTQLASTLTDLADDLDQLGRGDEAEASRTEAGPRADGVAEPTRVGLGAPVTWSPLSARESYAATTARSTAPDRSTVDRQAETTAWLAAEREAAHRLEQARLEQARVEAERRAAERSEADRLAAEQRAAALARAEEAQRTEAVRLAAAEEAERLERKRRREARLEEHRLEVERRAAEQRAAEGGEPAEVEQPEVEAEVESEPVAPEPEPIAPEPEPEAIEPEPDPGKPEPEPKPVAPEPVAPEPTAPQPEPDAVAAAQQAWQDAKGRGERRAARAALEHYVELLRPRSEADLATYGPTLQQALEELSSARLRGGDLFGSRAPAKEAKALARALNG